METGHKHWPLRLRYLNFVSVNLQGAKPYAEGILKNATRGFWLLFNWAIPLTFIGQGPGM